MTHTRSGSGARKIHRVAGFVLFGSIALCCGDPRVDGTAVLSLCEEAKRVRNACDLAQIGGCEEPLSPSGECVVRDCILARADDCAALEDVPLAACADQCFERPPMSCEGSSRTFTASARCNREDDCADGSEQSQPSDERKCLFCANGAITQPSYRCDGIVDCGDESDELGCFVCPDDAGPRPPDWQCDGQPDCPSGADEADCTPFECGDDTRVPSSFVCDGVLDCGNGSDEEQNCLKRRCKSGSALIDARFACDRIADCPDDSDELGCEETFSCQNGAVIAGALFCDGVRDCSDGSDELRCQ